MSCAPIRISVFTFAVLLLSGCGGSSGNTSGGGSGDGSPTTVTVTFTGGAPSAIATQIGTGSFNAVTPASTITLTLPSGTTKFAVAYVCPLRSSGQETDQYVWERTVADGASFTTPRTTAQTPVSQAGTLAFSVDASAIPGVSFMEINAQNGQGTSLFRIPAATHSSSFSAPAGNDRVDVLAYNVESINTGGFVEQFTTLVGAKTLNGQAVPGSLNGGSTVALGAPDQTTPETITYANLPPGFYAPSSQVFYVPTAAIEGFLLAGNASAQYPAVPAAMAQAGGTYSILAFANSNSAASEFVTVNANFTSAGPITIAFPVPWAYSGPTPAALPTLAFAYTGFAGNGGVYEGGTISWSPATLPIYSYTVFATANYQDGAQALAFPDLSEISGFDPNPASGTFVNWQAVVVQQAQGALVAPFTSLQTSVSNDGSYTVP